ncbi:MAG TPA: ATP-dependent DNA ligase [Geminicoccaceae bacterium]
MRRFSDLYEALDSTTSTSAKVEVMAQYFRAVPAEDAAWAVFFLTGQRLKRLISGRTLRDWALHYTGLPEWLVADAHAATGDSAETVTLLVHHGTSADTPALPLHRWLEDRILPLRELPDERRYAEVTAWWRQLPARELFVLHKLLTGAFRVGVSRPLVVRALAAVAGMPRATIAHRLMGRWQPTAAWYQGLLAADHVHDDPSRPYPFFLASPLEQPPHQLGNIDSWLAEWKWDGVRAQLIRRRGEVFLWSRGEELVTGRFPELAHAAARLPAGCVLDGEILAWDERGVLPFAILQTRIGRDTVSARDLERAPVSFLAYDLLEEEGQDIRALPLAERLTRLAVVLEGRGGRLLRSHELAAADWRTLETARAGARERHVEGLMLKRRDSAYGAGRQRGAWWKWKVDPLSVDAVLVYAQAGSGRRANLFTDYTFAIWQGDALVPIAKAYSGLSDPEMLALDRWIRRHTLERFGPVRQVAPEQVFELAFEGISRSSRHKSGIALRFPRIARWRTDKPAQEADRLADLHALLPEAISGEQG